MSAEHPINPEDIGRQPDGTFHVPDEALSSERQDYIEKAQEQVAALSPETRSSLQAVTEQYLAIKKQSLEFADSWPDLVGDAERIHEHITDTYTAYKSGNIDEEELQVALAQARESYANLRAMMDPDERETPAE